jgi:hypothetical protein
MKQNIAVRLAAPEDAASFAAWAAQNPDIPDEDIEAVQKSTPLTLVVEVDGKPEMYLPLIPAMTIGYLGFNPDQDVRTRATVLREMRAALANLQNTLGIEYAYVHTKAEYPMGRWALKNGFKQTPKDAFVLERN